VLDKVGGGHSDPVSIDVEIVSKTARASAARRRIPAGQKLRAIGRCAVLGVWLAHLRLERDVDDMTTRLALEFDSKPSHLWRLGAGRLALTSWKPT
jgi:hypothetical protein